MPSFVDEALQPGSRQFMVLLNGVLLSLVLVLCTVLYSQLEDSIHVFVMLFLSVGLLVSINWFIIEANRLKDTQATEPSGTSTDPTNMAVQPQAIRAKTD